MRGGNLDELIEIEYPVSTPDAVYGSPVITWAPLVVLPGSPQVHAPLWAQFQDALPSRSESEQQTLVLARNQARVRMRYRSDVTSDMRILRVSQSTYYQIVGGPAMIGRKQWTELTVEKYSS